MGPAGGSATRDLPEPEARSSPTGPSVSGPMGTSRLSWSRLRTDNRLRLGTVKGDARTAIASGLAIVGVAGAGRYLPARSVAIFSAAVSGIALLGHRRNSVVLANRAFRVSSWAAIARPTDGLSIAARLDQSFYLGHLTNRSPNPRLWSHNLTLVVICRLLQPR